MYSLIKHDGKSWKDMKSKLGLNYVDTGLLHHLPEKYSFISQEVWDQFVKRRISKPFKKESVVAKLKAARKKLHHQLGCKGYKGKEIELVSMCYICLHVVISICFMYKN